MCEATTHILLCTCGAVSKGKDGTWLLHKQHPSDEDHRRWRDVIGSMAMPEVGESYITTKLQEDLNNYQVFDFQYLPTPGDMLIIYLSNQEYRFEFDNDRWSEGNNFRPIINSDTDLDGVVKLQRQYF
jgi:hypothetical protein